MTHEQVYQYMGAAPRYTPTKFDLVESAPNPKYGGFDSMLEELEIDTQPSVRVYGADEPPSSASTVDMRLLAMFGRLDGSRIRPLRPLQPRRGGGDDTVDTAADTECSCPPMDDDTVDTVDTVDTFDLSQFS